LVRWRAAYRRRVPLAKVRAWLCWRRVVVVVFGAPPVRCGDGLWDRHGENWLWCLDVYWTRALGLCDGDNDNA